MNLPGFTAEESLYNSATRYRAESVSDDTPAAGLVTPQGWLECASCVATCMGERQGISFCRRVCSYWCGGPILY